MSLDASYHIIYGYRLEGSPISGKIYDESKEIDEDDAEAFYDDITNVTEHDLILVEDYMSGEYSYLGINVLYKSDNYGSEIHRRLNIKTNDTYKEQLEHAIKEDLLSRIPDIYETVLKDIEPGMYFVKRVY